MCRDCFSVARKEGIGSLLGQPGTWGSAIPGETTMQSKAKGLVREMTCLVKRNLVPRLLIWERVLADEIMDCS